MMTSDIIAAGGVVIVAILLVGLIWRWATSVSVRPPHPWDRFNGD
jgi:hypothetical protein